ncbi:MAG: helix-turn-helix transcriptional regulator [Hyphomicrobium sp.]
MTRMRLALQSKVRLIPAEDVIAKARRNPEYRAAYDALEEEFALVASVIEARTRAKLTQEQLAKRMGTTQAVVARLESGRTMPSTRTLERFAKATGTRLRITFEPVKQGKARG